MTGVNRLPSLVRQHIAALRALVVFTVLLGIIYPAVIYGIGQAAFPGAANGSLVRYHGRVVGSALLCQEFTGATGNPLPRYFQPRPSNAANPAVKSDHGCDPGFSGATNLGPGNPDLLAAIAQRKKAVAAFNGVSPASVPADAVTASGSGLDPDISPRYAYLQVNRVARARHLRPAVVRALVTAHIQGRDRGFLGEPVVSVLAVNIALDELADGR